MNFINSTTIASKKRRFLASKLKSLVFRFRPVRIPVFHYQMNNEDRPFTIRLRTKVEAPVCRNCLAASIQTKHAPLPSYSTKRPFFASRYSFGNIFYLLLINSCRCSLWRTTRKLLYVLLQFKRAIRSLFYKM